MKKYLLISAMLVLLLPGMSLAQTEKDSATINQIESPPTWFAGIRFQKAAGFYWSNGITAEYTQGKLWKHGVGIGLNYISSKLGTALSSNAIPVYEIHVSGIKYFRKQHNFKPLTRLNLGYAHANYGSDIFNEIPNQSFLTSLEAGAAYDFKFPLRLSLTGGYNFIAGDGMSGLGTTYPFYAQFSMIYRFKPEKK
jgi:hypothetical protein